MNFFDNHKYLFGAATLLFVVLTVLVAIIPALNNQELSSPLDYSASLKPEVLKGKEVFVANGCVACHSQQVRNVEMDKIFGSRPSVAADYSHMTRMDTWRNTATLMGTERTGPDLTDIGTRQPSQEWNLVHLYNPRIVVAESIMPSYPFLFEYKLNPTDEDVVVNIPIEYAKDKNKKVVATQEALHLIAYLQSLKQIQITNESDIPEFLYKRKLALAKEGGDQELDGQSLYITHCQACHQADGKGLTGAFPPLVGSKVVMDDDLQLYIDIIMNGYDSRPEYGPMPAVGVNANLSLEEVTAIVNYERTNWGNEGKKISASDIKDIYEYVKNQSM